MTGVQTCALPIYLDFVLKYASSPCVSENSSLWYKLSEYAGPLLPLSEIILALCNALVKNDSDIEVDRSYYQYHADQVTRLLIRLYDESYEHAPGVFTRCLDTWDTLFEAGTSRVRALTKAMDSFQGG